MIKPFKKCLLLCLSFLILLPQFSSAAITTYPIRHPIKTLIIGQGIRMASIRVAGNMFIKNPQKAVQFFIENPSKTPVYSKWALKELAKKQPLTRYEELLGFASILGISSTIPPYSGDIVKPMEDDIIHTPITDNDEFDTIPPSNIEIPDNGRNIITTPWGEEIDTNNEFPMETPKDWREYVLLKNDRSDLNRNLEASGDIKKKGSQAHHIVALKNKLAQVSRDILEKYGIDINDAMNGVRLPGNESVDMGGIRHNGSHPKDYIEKVNKLLEISDKKGKDAVIETLKDIKNKLGNAKYNDDWRTILD